MSGRGRYLLGRILWAVVIIFVVITFNFFLFRVLPGDPAKAGSHDPRLSPESIAALTERFGLDKPLFINLERRANPLDSQYFAYLAALTRGDLGMSYAFRDESVASMLGEALVNSLWLILPAQFLAIFFGIALGVLAAWRRGTSLDVVSLTFSLFMWSLPTFFLAILLLVFGANYPGPADRGQGDHRRHVRIVVGAAGRHPAATCAMPTLAFTLVLLGEYMLIMRSSVLDVFSEDYILTAKAKGLSTFQIIKDHALRNAMLPMVTLIAINLAFTVSGAIQVEEVFSWPGLGNLTVEAISERDYPVLQGAFLLIAVAVVIANLVADMVIGWLDPRVTSA